MNYEFRFDIVWNNFDTLLAGLQTTIMLSVLSMLLGTVLGLTVALARLRLRHGLAVPFVVYVEVFRGTPALVQIVWIYYCLPIIPVSYTHLTLPTKRIV